MNAVVSPQPPMVDADELRAATWRLLGRLLADPPDEALLDALRAIESPGERPIEQAWRTLRQAAIDFDAPAWEHEYHALFVGLAEGELNPYGSWYLVGRVMDRPLARLRGALAELGIEREPHAGEPEDHAGAVCETLSLLAADPTVTVERQRQFYQAHVGTWLPRFFKDLSEAPSAHAYRSVAALGAAFVAIEESYLSMLV